MINMFNRFLFNTVRYLLNGPLAVIFDERQCFLDVSDARSITKTVLDTRSVFLGGYTVATPQLQQNDAGVTFIVTVTENGTSLDISSATSIQFIFERPDGTLLTTAGVFFSNGTDGKVQYVTKSGDIDASGTWKYQVHVVTPSFDVHSDVGKFKVSANLPT